MTRVSATVKPSSTLDSSMNFFQPQSCSFLQKRCSVSAHAGARGHEGARQSWFAYMRVFMVSKVRDMLTPARTLPSFLPSPLCGVTCCSKRTALSHIAVQCDSCCHT
eukprot:1150099-Pelagomonas_calceolata.AAC.8